MDAIFDQWDLYARIVAGDYMRHAELISRLRGMLPRDGRPLRVLDLGCGDGSLARRSLADVPVGRYVGIDLSADAVARARAHPPTGSGAGQAEVVLLCDD